MSEAIGHMPPPQEVVPSPSPGDWDTQGAGRGNGGGNLRLSMLGEDEQAVETWWDTPVELMDGQGFWDAGAFGHDDTLCFCARLPATVATPNEGAGNCNLVPTGMGWNVIVPAAGDGSHDVTLADVTPIPTDGDGYWDCDYETGEVTACDSPGEASYQLFDQEFKHYFLRYIPMGGASGVWGPLDNPRVRWAHQNWRIRLECAKASTGAGEFSAWLRVFLPSAVELGGE